MQTLFLSDIFVTVAVVVSPSSLLLLRRYTIFRHMHVSTGTPKLEMLSRFLVELLIQGFVLGKKNYLKVYNLRM